MLQAMHGYKTPDECFADRHNHRAEWFTLIREYTRYDPSKMAREILVDHDIYCGMRSVEEFKAAKELFDMTIWIDASRRIGKTEGTSSCEITADMCDVVIDNNSPDPRGPGGMFSELNKLFTNFI